MTNKQTFLADNLSFLSTQRGLSLIALAENTGIDPSTVYRLADPANSRQPRARTLRSLADYFHVEPFDLLEKDLRNPSFTKPNQEGLFGEGIPARKSAPLEKSELIPLVKITDADAIDPSVMCLFTNDYDAPAGLSGFAVEKWIHRPCGVEGADIIAFEIIGDSMAPKILNKDIVFISHFENAIFKNKPRSPFSGEYVFAKMSIDGRCVVGVRKVLINDFGETTLVAENPCFTGKTVSLLVPLGVVVGLCRAL